LILIRLFKKSIQIQTVFSCFSGQKAQLSAKKWLKPDEIYDFSKRRTASVGGFITI